MENSTVEDDYSKRPANFNASDPWVFEDMSEDDLVVFLDNKIVKHKAIYDKMQDGRKPMLFKDILVTYCKKLAEKLGKKDPDFKFKKWHAMLIAFLYCKGQNITRAKFVYDLFAKDGKFGKSEDFSAFQYALYLTASFAALSTRTGMSESYEEDFPKLEKEKIKELLDACQEKDCKNLVTVIDNKFFGEDGSISYPFEDFIKLIKKSDKDESLGFILSSKGIRYFLEKYNV